MFKVNDFLHIGESSPVVNKIVVIGIVFLERKIIKHKLPAIYSKGLSGDIIGVFIFFGSVEDLGWTILLGHTK